MNPIVFLATFCIASTLSFEIVQNDQGEQYYLIPIEHQRFRRAVDLNWDVSKGSQGTRATINPEGTINLGNSHHSITAGGLASKNFGPNSPITSGGTLGYKNEITNSQVKAAFVDTPQWGKDLSIKATHPLWQPDKNTKLEVYGQYDRHFGGPFGTQNPSYSGGLQFTHMFGRQG